MLKGCCSVNFTKKSENDYLVWRLRRNMTNTVPHLCQWLQPYQYKPLKLLTKK